MLFRDGPSSGTVSSRNRRKQTPSHRVPVWFLRECEIQHKAALSFKPLRTELVNETKVTYLAYPILPCLRPWVRTQRQSDKHASIPASRIRVHSTQAQTDEQQVSLALPPNDKGRPGRNAIPPSRTFGISPLLRATRPLDNLWSFLNIEILRFRQNANDVRTFFSCHYM